MRSIIAAIAVLIALPAQAQSLRAVRPFEGAMCMGLRETADTRAGRLPWIVAAPQPGAAKVGEVGDLVYVSKPVQTEGAYTKVLIPDRTQPSGARAGWLRSSWLEPWRVVSDPRATCTPMVMSDGALGWK